MFTRKASPLVALTGLVAVLLAGCTANGSPDKRPEQGSAADGNNGSPGASTTYGDVVYQDGTAVIDATAVRKGLRSENGTVYRFDSDTAGIDKLRAGMAVILAGKAVRKVSAVRRDGDETVVETTTPKLTDAIRSGTVGWSRKVDWGAVPRAAYKEAAATAGMRPSIVPAGYHAAASAPGELNFGGTVSGFETELKLTPQSDGKLDFEVSAGRSNIKVTAKGWLSSFVSETELEYDSGTGTLFNSTVQGLKGEATVEWSAIGVGSAFDSDTPSFSLPFSVPIPIQVGPLPMVLTIKSAMRFSPAFVGKSSSGGSFKVNYDSDFGFDMASPKPNPVATVRAALAALGDKDTVTAGFGPVGFGWGWEFPRLELGLTGIGTYAFLTSDMYMAGQFTPGTTLTSDIPPCQRADLTMHAIAGYKVEALGFTFASGNTTLWEKKFPFYKDDEPCTLTGRPD